MPGVLGGVVTLNLLDSAYGERFAPYLLGAVAAALMLAASATLFRAVFRPELAKRERASAGLQRPRSKAGTVALAGIPAALAVASVVIHRRRTAVERELLRAHRQRQETP